MKIKSLTNKSIILILACLILVNLCSYLFLFDKYIMFLEKYLTRDGIISSPDIVFIKIISFLIFIFLIFLYVSDERSYFYTKFLKSILFYRSLNKVEKFTFIFIFILLIPSIGKLIHNNGLKYMPIDLIEFLYKEDGFLEYLTAFFALISSFMILLSLINQKSKIEIFVKIFLSLLFFIFGMEEISWGQRIIGWETPSALAQINHQNETNIHNIFNPYHHAFYISFNLVITLFIYLSINYKKFIVKFFKSEKYIFLLPNKKYNYFIYIFLFAAVQCQLMEPYGYELTEEIFSTLILLYSFNQLTMKIRQRDKKI